MGGKCKSFQLVCLVPGSVFDMLEDKWIVFREGVHSLVLAWKYERILPLELVCGLRYFSTLEQLI